MQLVWTEMGLQVHAGGLAMDREMPAPPRIAPPAPALASEEVVIRRHPAQAGAWCIGRRIPGAAAWVYHGCYRSAVEAARAAG